MHPLRRLINAARSCAARPGAALPIAALLVAALALPGCDAIGKTIDKARMKLLGVVVTTPEKETAEWVLRQVIDAAANDNEEEGWEDFQLMLHSEERSPNALRGWYENGWKRMRRQVKDYVNPDNSFKIVDYKEIMASSGLLAGIEFFIESHKKEMPTPCAVYKDAERGDRWRVRRCSL